MAIAPGLLLGLYVYMKDSKQAKPFSLIIKAFLMGVLSFGISLGLGYLLHTNTTIEHDSIADQMIRAVVFVGLVEELSKFIFVRGILFRSKHFIKPFDGVVFAVIVGMGFAIAENIIYVINGGGGTAIVRMFTAIPAHAVFAVIMGFFIGEAKVFSSSRGLYSIIALLFATFAHGYYDYFLFLPFIPGLWLQTIISLVIVIVMVHYAFRLRKNEIIDQD
jgi:RsiW-degrading membrane proteinase PrsW (M82 family)